MAIANGYATLAELKARLGVTDSASDAVYEATVEAASRAIDGYCGRRFYQLTEARYFTPVCSDTLDVDDLVSVSAIATDIGGTRSYATSWSASDYELEPANAAGVGFPYTRICQKPYGTQWFPVLRRSTKVTAVWGWPAIPDDINEACLLLAARLAKRPASPYGIGGDGGEAAVISPVDLDLVALLAGYRVFFIGAV